MAPSMLRKCPFQASLFQASLAPLLWLLAFTAVADVAADAKKLDAAFPRSELHIATSDAKLHRFDIWVADTDDRRSRGLMFVEHMAPGAGMLFIYANPQHISMWMKNTKIPLDMLFVSPDGKVAKVVANTEPMSLKTIESNKDVNAVIELNGGTAAKLHITAGAQVIHPAFAKR